MRYSLCWKKLWEKGGGVWSWGKKKLLQPWVIFCPLLHYKHWRIYFSSVLSCLCTKVFVMVRNVEFFFRCDITGHSIVCVGKVLKNVSWNNVAELKSWILSVEMALTKRKVFLFKKGKCSILYQLKHFHSIVWFISIDCRYKMWIPSPKVQLKSTVPVSEGKVMNSTTWDTTTELWRDEFYCVQCIRGDNDTSLNHDASL
jgi:hypothetical protein